MCACGHRIAQHVKAQGEVAHDLVGYDTRFYSEEFSQLAVDILQQHGIRTLLCETFTPTPAIAFEIMRRKLDAAINFTASHNPAQYHGLKFSSADAGPALPVVTKDIETRVARMIAKTDRFRCRPPQQVTAKNQPAKKLPARKLSEAPRKLVQFETLRKARPSLVVDALHAAAPATWTAPSPITASRFRACAPNAIACSTDRPDVSEENLAPLRETVVDRKQRGASYRWRRRPLRHRRSRRYMDPAQPDSALVYDYLVETRKWKMPAARSVATTK